MRIPLQNLGLQLPPDLPAGHDQRLVHLHRDPLPGTHDQVLEFSKQGVFEVCRKVAHAPECVSEERHYTEISERQDVSIELERMWFVFFFSDALLVDEMNPHIQGDMGRQRQEHPSARGRN